MISHHIGTAILINYHQMLLYRLYFFDLEFVFYFTTLPPKIWEGKGRKEKTFISGSNTKRTYLIHVRCIS